MFYKNLFDAILPFLIWWGILFLLLRVFNSKNSSWKKDLLVTMIQSLVVVVLFPMIAYFFIR